MEYNRIERKRKKSVCIDDTSWITRV